jgi:hypothetical protein
MRGNDGKLYISKPSKLNVFSWRPVRNASASKAPARRSRRSRKSPQATRAKNPRRKNPSRRAQGRTLKGRDVRHYVLTDPAILGVTSTGDVDDIVAILYAGLTLKDNVTFIICDDDDEHTRFNLFYKRIGHSLHELFGCSFMKESDIEGNMFGGTVVHMHSQIETTTAESIIGSAFAKLFVQGNAKNAYNLLKSGGPQLFEFMQTRNPRVEAFSTEETSFTISYDAEVRASLKPVLQHVYDNLFQFEVRKKIGLAAHIGGLVDRLYSDTGLNGEPGNGIKPFKHVIDTLRIREQDLPATLVTALDASTARSNAAADSKRNLRDIVVILNKYCNYEDLIRDGRLPHMGNLGEVQVRAGVDAKIRAIFETGRSTPLFDFAAMYWALNGKEAPKETLQDYVTGMLVEISRTPLPIRAAPPPPPEKQLGGGVADEDVVYMDENICILRPDARAGALCVTRIYSSGIDCETGINKQHYENPRRRNNIFFRAATRLNPGIVRQPVHWVDELKAYFEPSDLQPKEVRPDDGTIISRVFPNNGMAVIRVDPYRTSIFYSERCMSLPNMGENMKPDWTYADFLRASTGTAKIGYGTIQSSMIDDLYARNVDGYIAPYCRLFLLQRL